MAIMTAIIAGMFTLGAVYLKDWLEKRDSEVEPTPQIVAPPPVASPPSTLDVHSNFQFRRPIRVVVLGAWALIAGLIAIPATVTGVPLLGLCVAGSGPAYLLFLEMKRTRSNFPLLMTDVAVYIGAPYTILAVILAFVGAGSLLWGLTVAAIELYSLIIVIAGVCYFFKLALAHLSR